MSLWYCLINNFGCLHSSEKYNESAEGENIDFFLIGILGELNQVLHSFDLVNYSAWNVQLSIMM